MEHHRFDGSRALVRLVVPPLCHHEAFAAILVGKAHVFLYYDIGYATSQES